MNQETQKNILTAVVLVALAVVWRLINSYYSLAPNLEIVIVSSLFAARFLPKYYALLVPLMIMLISDLFLGMSAITMYVWVAFIIIGLSGLVLRRASSVKQLLGQSFVLGLVGSAFFFLATNFGVWMISDGTFYTSTWQGLVNCYLMGLPFYRTMFIGNMVFVPVFFTVGVYVFGLAKTPVAGGEKLKTAR